MAWGLNALDDGQYATEEEPFECLPSSISSIDPIIRQEAAKPIPWVDEAHDSDRISSSDASRCATPSLSHSGNATPTIGHHETKADQVTITSGVRAWTKDQAHGASDALIKYATASPLLPQQIAELVSNLSIVARVSLKAAAFFIEVILEAAKNGTGMGLGITRRALISAVGTARAVQSLTTGQEWDAKATGKASNLLSPVRAANDAFLSILDKYTAVGIYLIHHTFTLTELFTMSGFHLIGSTVTAGLAVADESVRTIDGIFGSNETSRALASFITLIRGEVTNDPRYASLSTVAVLTKLTKAITAFAVLQNSTYKRSSKSMKMRVLYDCTVLGEVEAKSWRSLIVGSGNFVRNSQPALLPSPQHDLESLSLRSPSSNLRELAPTSGSGPSHTSSSRPNAFMTSSKSRTHLGDGLCLTDIDSGNPFPNSSHSQWTSPRPSQLHLDPAMPDDASILADLDFLVGTDDPGDANDGLPANLTSDQLPHDLRQRLKHYSDDQLRDGVVINEVDSGRPQPKQVRRIVKRDHGRGNRETVYEVTTEIIETIETVTTVEESRGPPRKQRSSKRIETRDEDMTPARYSRGSRDAENVVQRDVTTTKSGTETHSIFEGGRETKLEEDEEWCEIRTTNAKPTRSAATGAILATSSSENSMEDAKLAGRDTLPEAPNGSAVVRSRQNRSSKKERDDSASRMPVVLKTITKKLIQKHKTIRRIEVHTDYDEDMQAEGLVAENVHAGRKQSDQAGSNSRPGSRTPVTAPTSPNLSMRPPLSPIKPLRQVVLSTSPPPNSSPPKNSEMSRSLQKVFRRAKGSLKSGGHPETPASTSERLPREPQRFMPTIAVASPSRTSVPETTLQHATARNLTTPARTLSPPPSPSHKPKRVASPPVLGQAKAVKHGSVQSPGRATSSRSLAKELPAIPQRGASAQPLVWPEAATSWAPPATPTAQGSNREPPKRLSRAPSITSIRSFASRAHLQSTATSNAKQSKHGLDHTAFPQAHLVENLRRFMRYSSAAYGQNFMRILGIGSLDYFFPDTSKHHANVWAFAHHVGISVDSILLNSFSEPQPLYSEKMSPLVNYVAIDDASKAVVLTCRGTLGLSDILTDLTCDFEDIQVEGGKSSHHYQVHSGMLASTRRLCDESSTVMQTIRLALQDNPDYGLVITGHSLGGGVASLAAVELSCPADLFRQQVLRKRADHGAKIQHPRIFTPFVTSLDSGLPPGRPIHAYAYGVPAVSSPDLSKHCQGLVTSVIHGHDFVPTLSLGMVRDFKNIAQTLSEETETDIAREIVGRVLGVHRKRQELRKSVEFRKKMPSHLSTLEPPRPQEAPLQQRQMALSNEELLKGKTRNMAAEADYQDPSLLEDELDPYSYSSGGGQSWPSKDDPDLSDWLWSLIKTIRADMDSAKLYPPGDVYCIESFPVFVTSSMKADSEIVHTRHDGGRVGGKRGEEGTLEAEDGEAKRAQAHRVILRYCEDVEKRFSEPIFAKSMMRDHIPTNYELCMSLLYESIIDSADQHQQP